MSDLSQGTRLRQHNLKLTTAVFMIYSLCAAGAFGLEDMIPAAGPGLTLVLLIIFPFIWGAPQALVSAELGSAIPVEGGYYRWAQRGLGEYWGFQTGWWRILSNYVDIALYVVLSVSYLSLLVPMTDVQAYMAKAGIIILFTILNLRGIKDVSRVSAGISMFVLIAFAGVTVVGFAHWNADPFIPFIPEGQSLFTSVGSGFAIVMWMYAGYESMSTLGGEVKDPMVIPKAVLIAMPLIALSYILPTMTGLASIGQWENWGAGGISYMDVAKLTGLSWAVPLFIFVAIIGNLSIFNSTMASISRAFFAMAEDNLAPRFLVKCNKRGIPQWPILSLSAICLILVQFDFTVIVVIDVTLLMASYALIWVSGIVLRIKEPELKRPFKIPGGLPGIILCFSPALLIVFIALLINGTDYFFGGMLGIITGPIMYVVYKKIYGGMAKTDPQKYALNPITRLAKGDLYRIALTFGIFTVIAAIACIFLPWYEGSWGPEYYAETYGNPDAFVNLLKWIRYMTLGFGAVAIIAVALAKKYEKGNEKIESQAS